VAPRRHRFGLYFDLHLRNITGADVITFLRYLLRHLRGSVVLLWDGGKLHRHRDVHAFLQSIPA
jgi:transposase